ncbi:MAG: c-type cytochrome [Pseudomonadota bacterium]|jgi:cytochrome c oxidase cbb3-type subunit III|nr:c-type cytochrome [Pseudomonadota bacterium]|tara:strand:+ start:300 stop:1112 length:813 start_codon:yes stop_codon:yes gene_type:complete
MGFNLIHYWKALLIGGVLSLSLASLLANAEDAGNLFNTPYDINQGERYFERQCSRCHGFDAKGNDETGAPDLTGRLSRASSNVGIFNIIREGVPNTAMLPVDSDLPDERVWQLVTYIESLRYDPSSVELAGSANSGDTLFRGKGECADCHMVNGQGGRLGPDLSRIGESAAPDELMSSMTNPHDNVAPRWWTISVTGPDGITRNGFRMGEDSFSLRIMDNDADLWSFRKNQIQSYERIEQSTMPSYDQSLSESELDDLVAYLFSLRREEN